MRLRSLIILALKTDKVRIQRWGKGHKKDFSKHPEGASDFERKPLVDSKDHPDGDRKFRHGKYSHENRPTEASEDIQISTER